MGPVADLLTRIARREKDYFPTSNAAFWSVIWTLLKERIGPSIENSKNINRKKSSDESVEPIITSDPPSHNSKTAIDTPIVSIIGDEVNRNLHNKMNCSTVIFAVDSRCTPSVKFMVLAPDARLYR